MGEVKKMEKKFPIGVQAFSEIVSGNYLYVDKTEFVYNLVNDYKYVFLSRPRRFGKSLLSSTLRCYLEGRKELFDGLKIMNLEEKWEQHPVLHFDFSGISNVTPEKLDALLDVALSNYESIYGRNEKEKFPNDRLAGLIRRAYEKTGHKVGLIIDEYDAPLLDVLHIPDKLEGVRGEMTNFYSPIKKSDQYLKFVFLTGITKFSQLSIFSKLNNLTDISMFPQYSAICGITQQELERDFKEPIVEFSKILNISEEALKSLLKNNYDGYHFSEDLTDVYNPFSLISAFGNKRIYPYWFASATPTFLVNYMAEHPIDETSLTCMQAVPVGDFNVSPEVSDKALPLLYQSGYLTIKGYDEMFDEYILGYPNKEVKNGFENSLLSYYNGSNITGSSFVLNFTKLLYKDDIENALTLMQTYYSSIPYDLQNKEEKHFQTIFYLIFSLLGQYIQSEVKTAIGRADAVVKTPNSIYVFEMKVDKTAEIALQQIDDKGYLIPYTTEDKRLVKVGLNFSSETRTLQDWIVVD